MNKTWRQELAEIKYSDKVDFKLLLKILRGLAEDTENLSCPNCGHEYREGK